MITKKVKVDTYFEHAYCDCGEEFQLVPEDLNAPKITLAIWPPRPITYDYICPKCGNKMTSEISYPRLIHAEVSV